MKSLTLASVNHDSHDALTVTALPGGDIVGQPAISDGVRAFQFGGASTRVSLPSSQFRGARVTLRFPDNANVEFDQLGLIFLRPHPECPDPRPENPGDKRTFPRFVKAVLENYSGTTYFAVSASNDTPPEWGLWPLSHHESFLGKRTVTIELAKYGIYLVVTLVNDDGDKKKRQLIHMVPWCFLDEKESDPNMLIGVFVARPNLKDEEAGRQPLTVEFTDFEVDTAEGSEKFVSPRAQRL